MAVDIKKLFNEELPAALAKNADDAKTIGAKFQMNITGEGAWFIDVSATGPKCVAGEEAADCVITIAAEDFQKLVENPQAISETFIEQTYRLSNSAGAAEAFAALGRYYLEHINDDLQLEGLIARDAGPGLMLIWGKADATVAYAGAAARAARECSLGAVAPLARRAAAKRPDRRRGDISH